MLRTPRSRRTSVVVFAVAWAVVPMVGCSDSSPSEDGAGDGGTVPDTGPTADLAPSQITASTVARPPTPPPCDPAVIEVGPPSSAASDPVLVPLVMTNRGDEWCEVDVSGSASADPRMEPDVWFEVGGEAELLVQLDLESCDDPAPVESVEVDVNGDVRAVALDPAPAACSSSIVAFYPVES